MSNFIPESLSAGPGGGLWVHVVLDHAGGHLHRAALAPDVGLRACVVHVALALHRPMLTVECEA